MTEHPHRQTTGRTLEIEIDHRTVTVPAGISVLHAAEENGIAIPSLCAHKDLSPFGGCRLCMVEIEGMRGYPLACSTIVGQGMKVLTDTAVLRDMRREVLQLILSEHPSSCLVCGESSECAANQFTIRKTGVSTGCRFCPKDEQCELQRVTARIGLDGIGYPIVYHGYEAEHDDPFYDRDYNLCILCGRCVRMCHEVRGASVLAFQHRGSRVRIGPAFGVSHLDAGCEFCGACVTVCPTGALADKVSKWDGRPDGTTVSTCPFCGLGCRIEVHHKDGRLSAVHPAPDPDINDGQLCLRGRFCLPEAAHHHRRAKKPMLLRGGYFREVDWPEARREVAAKLAGLGTEDFLMAVSGDLTNESLFAAKRFVHDCVGAGGLDSAARGYLPGGPELWRRLFALPVSIKAVAEADAVLVVGLDSRFSFSVIGVRIRRALAKGARLVTVDARETNLALAADLHLRPIPGREGLLVRFLAEQLTGRRNNTKATAAETGIGREGLDQVVDTLLKARRLAVVVAPTAFGYSDSGPLFDGLFLLAGRPQTGFLPLYHGANTRGALELGILDGTPAEPELHGVAGITLEDVIAGRKRPKVIYLVGQVPFAQRPDCDFLISQDTYLPPFPVDAFLPAANFAEGGGTLVNIEGRIQELAVLENPPDGALAGYVRPDWRIFAELSREMGGPVLSYKNEADIRREIRLLVPDFKVDRRPRRLKTGDNAPVAAGGVGEPAGKGEFLLCVEPGGFHHRGMDLAAVVEGLGELGLEQGVRMNPDDLERLELAAGQTVAVVAEKRKLAVTACEDPACPPGVVFISRPPEFGGLASPDLAWFLHALQSNPVRASIEKIRPAAAEKKPGFEAGPV